MKTIKPGDKPIDVHPWWTGEGAGCRNCGGQFLLEYTDIPSSTVLERRPNGRREAIFHCPTVIDTWHCPGMLRVVIEGRGGIAPDPGDGVG